jgi:3,4-dihydroxy-2-butanone 4-phosphate synthase
MTPSSPVSDAYPEVKAALDQLSKGSMVVLLDDSGQADGAVLAAAEHVGAAEINFMAKEARGLVCLALTPERAETLHLRPMEPRGTSYLGRTSLNSIDAVSGITTGISAADRSHTIAVAIDPEASAEDVVAPGHVFPLRSHPGGVLAREGMVEAAVDFVAAANLAPAAVLCHVLRGDGHVARGDDLLRFANRHGLVVARVSEIACHIGQISGRRQQVGTDVARKLRDVMGHFATGVTVVTARRADSTPVGTTANSICSVSLRPPLVLACLAEDSATLGAICDTRQFAINILGDHQRDHSERFVAKGDAARAHEVAFDDHPLGLPILPASLAAIGCEVENIYSAGDHQIILGRVLSLNRSDSASGAPLLFYRGAYTHLQIERDVAAIPQARGSTSD